MQNIKKFGSFLNENSDLKNYMFFQNLKTIKEAVDKMLAQDINEVDEILSQHNWATDHIATSKDDIQEVCDFLCSPKTHESLNELSPGEPSLINQIKVDMMNLRMDGQRANREDDLSIGDTSVSVDFRDLGNWVHNEEDAWDREEDFREDDDQMIWAPGEYKKYMAKFEEWAKNKSWYPKVKLSIQGSEKNWVSFIVSIKK